MFGPRIAYQEVDLDEETLTRVAQEGGGKYFRAADSKRLSEIYDIIDREEKSEVDVKEFFHFRELYPYFLIPALALLGLEIALSADHLQGDSMTFAQAWVLHFLWLLPVVGLALLAYHRQRGKALARFAEPELLGRLTGADHPGDAGREGRADPRRARPDDFRARRAALGQPLPGGHAKRRRHRRCSRTSPRACWWRTSNPIGWSGPGAKFTIFSRSSRATGSAWSPSPGPPTCSAR